MNQIPCLGKYILSYIDNKPIFTCDACGDQDLSWVKFYDEYLCLYKNKDNWGIEKNKVACVLGFFCYMYEEFYGTKYVIVPKNPNPFGIKEIKDIWSLLAAFEGDVNRVRKYLYWLFKKNLSKTTAIISFGYLLAPGLVRKYVLYESKKNTLRRDSSLPNGFLEWCNDNVPSIFELYSLKTMNDLGALVSYCLAQKMEDGPEIILVKRAKEFGLISKDGTLKVGD